MNHEVLDLTDWQIDLRAVGYDGTFDQKSLKTAIKESGWHLHPLVPVNGSDWRHWIAQASNGLETISASGETDLEALGKLALQAIGLRQ